MTVKCKYRHTSVIYETDTRTNVHRAFHINYVLQFIASWSCTCRWLL